MNFRGIEIKPEWIFSVIPDKRSIVLKNCPVLKLVELAERQEGKLILLKLDTEKELQDAKFEHVQELKKQARPEDRVADYEIRDENGFIDFEKMERLVEKRKTSAEKSEERKQELEIAELISKIKKPNSGKSRGSF